MVHISSWEANSHSASQEIPRLLWNPKIHYCVHINPQLDSTLSQLNPIYIVHSRYLRSTSIWTSHPRIILWSVLFPSSFPSNYLSFPHVIHDLINLPMFGEEHNLCSSSLSNFLYPSLTLSLSAPDILLSTLFSDKLIFFFTWRWWNIIYCDI
jgi:hypothetical protein